MHGVHPFSLEASYWGLSFFFMLSDGIEFVNGDDCLPTSLKVRGFLVGGSTNVHPFRGAVFRDSVVSSVSL